MSNISSNSLAAAVGAGVENVQFSPSAEVIQRKIAIIATYDPLKVAVVNNIPIQVLSPEDAGDRMGFGFMAHRLALQAFQGGNGIPTYIIPQAETGAQATGRIVFTASSILAGTVHMYIGGVYVPYTILKDDGDADLADKAAAAILAMKELKVTSAVGESSVSPSPSASPSASVSPSLSPSTSPSTSVSPSASPSQSASSSPSVSPSTSPSASPSAPAFEANALNVTSKSKGPWGNDITLAFNINGEESPSGFSAVITPMSGGAGIPDIQDALDGLGTGDGANEIFITDMVHGYGQDTNTLDDIATYVGLGNTLIGLYSELVARPFRSLTGDVVAGSAGFTAIKAIGNGRKTDRANGVISVPDSKSHPSEIAAQTIGHIARINNIRAEEHYVDTILQGIHPGDKGSDRWTSEYSNRDGAVKAGVSPTLVKDGVVVLQNVVSFYHPDSVPITSNGYRSMRNISIIQNMFSSVRTTFEASKWVGISIVDSVEKVSNVTDRLKSRDLDDVRSDLVALARAWEGNAWIYQAQFTIDRLKNPVNGSGAISVRSGTNGFDSNVPVIFSGEGLILNALVQFDTSIAALN